MSSCFFFPFDDILGLYLVTEADIYYLYSFISSQWSVSYLGSSNYDADERVLVRPGARHGRVQAAGEIQLRVFGTANCSDKQRVRVTQSTVSSRKTQRYTVSVSHILRKHDP